MEPLNRCWVEINLDNLKHNYFELKQRLSARTMMLSVVKADAYGHGAAKVARVLQDECGTNWFAVAEFPEAKTLRRAGITRPIIVLGPSYPEQLEEAMKYDVTHSISSLKAAKELAAAAEALGVRPRVHIQLDTGMGRYGFNALTPNETVNEIEEICKMPSLDVNGIYTHFATADGELQEDIDYLKKQHWLFYNIVKVLKQQKHISFRVIHCANSATAMRFPQLQYNMIRDGISLYGMWPSGSPIEGFDIKPVMSFKTRIARIHTVQAGQPIGYGCTFIAERPTKVAVVTCGYADGIRRTLSNKGFVSVNGCVAPIIGNVCMDAMFVDVTDVLNPEEGDIVTVFGEGPITAETIAGLTGTISYEVLCNVSRRVPRIYYKNGEYESTLDYNTK